MMQATDFFAETRAAAQSLLVLAEDLTVVDATQSFLAAWALQRDQIAGRSVFDVFPDAAGPELAGRHGPDRLISIQEVFDHAPGFLCVMRGPEHVFEIVNKPCYQVVCHRPIVGMPVREALAGDADNDLIRLLDQVYATGQSYVGRAYKLLLQPAPGAECIEAYVDFVYQPIFSAQGSVAGILAFGYDVTKEVRVRAELRASEERFHLALEAAGDGVWDWEIASRNFTLSARGRAMLGYGENDIGSKLENWLAITHPEDQERVRANTMACVQGRIPFLSCEYRVRCRDGSWKWLLARGAVVNRDADGRATRMVGTTIDISSEQEILRRANFDSLTNLPNRNLFRDRLEQEVLNAARTGKLVALLFIDLDRFKEVNDLLGHDAGDQLLMQAAHRLCNCVRGSDTVARLGGDEFTVILSELNDMAHVEQVAQKLLAALAEPFHLGNEVAYVSGSVGITMYPADATEPEELIRNADQAMYAAKSSGRNQFSYFTRSMQEQAHMRLRLAGDLRNALRDGQLRVHYQPVIDLSNGRIVKAEALLRWQHPSLGAVDPSQFVPLAEESGMINEIGDWVFQRAASCSQRWSELLGAPFQISVNKSPVQFVSQAKEMSWSRHLHRLGLPGNSIAVEITEGLLLNASATVSDKLLEYRDAGIQVAIDDFGTGYSSMAYLKKFDIDYLKIDRSFVRDITEDDSDRAIAESVIVMAHRLGLKVIAEGIETAEQEQLLTAAGCDFGQGYLYAGAAPPEDFERMLAQDIKVASSRAH